MKICIVFLLAFPALFLTAKPSSKTDYVNQILKAYDLDSTIENARLEMTKQAHESMQRIVDDYKEREPALSAEYLGRIQIAANKSMEIMLSNFDREKMISTYSKVYEDNFSLEELEFLANFYKSESGRKSIKVERLAASGMWSEMSRIVRENTEAAVDSYVFDLKRILHDTSPSRENQIQRSVVMDDGLVVVPSKGDAEAVIGFSKPLGLDSCTTLDHIKACLEKVTLGKSKEDVGIVLGNIAKNRGALGAVILASQSALNLSSDTHILRIRVHYDDKGQADAVVCLIEGRLK